MGTRLAKSGSHSISYSQTTAVHAYLWPELLSNEGSGSFRVLPVVISTMDCNWARYSVQDCKKGHEPANESEKSA